MSTQESADALITVEEYSIFRGKTKESSQEAETKDSIQAAINAASSFFLKHIDRKLRAGSATEMFVGDGTTIRYTKQYPIVDVQTIERLDGTSWTSLSFSKILSEETGEVILTDGSIFFSGERYRMTYTYGYAIDDVPDDIKQVVHQLVHRAILLRKKEGVNSENLGDGSGTTYNLQDVPASFLRVVERHKRLSLG